MTARRDETYDFVVIGSGAAGLSAAVAAAAAGLKVLVLEKTAQVGGSTSLSGGNMWLPANPLATRAGIADSRAAALEYIGNFGAEDGTAVDAARQVAFVDAVTPMVTLFESLGMRYELSTGFPDNYDHLPGGREEGRILRAKLFDARALGKWRDRLRRSSIPLPVHASEGGVMLTALRSWRGRAMVARVIGRVLLAKVSGRALCGTGAALQGRMFQIALRLGVRILTDAAFTEFVIEDGRVAGVRLQHDNGSHEVRARRGVLAAAAGFARNGAMRERFMPQPVTTEWTQASPGENGDALLAMEAAGAATAWMGEAIWMTSWIAGERKLPVMGELARPRGILVDAAGRRFVNEGRPSYEIGRAAYERQREVAAVPAWYISDATARKRYMFAFNLPGKVPKKWLEEGWAKSAATIEDLARECGIDPIGLSNTVSRFNGFCETGVDADFQRGDSASARSNGDPQCRPNPNLGPVSDPPFWAVPIVPGDVGTWGGAVTDGASRVLRSDGSVIPGLYAAGNCAAPLAGPWYLGPGFSIGVAAVFGYLAAMDVADIRTKGR